MQFYDYIGIGIFLLILLTYIYHRRSKHRIASRQQLHTRREHQTQRERQTQRNLETQELRRNLAALLQRKDELTRQMNDTNMDSDERNRIERQLHSLEFEIIRLRLQIITRAQPGVDYSNNHSTALSQIGINTLSQLRSRQNDTIQNRNEGIQHLSSTANGTQQQTNSNQSHSSPNERPFWLNPFGTHNGSNENDNTLENTNSLFPVTYDDFRERRRENILLNILHKKVIMGKEKIEKSTNDFTEENEAETTSVDDRISTAGKKEDIKISQISSDIETDSMVSLQKTDVTCTICCEEYEVGEDIAWSNNIECCHCFHTDCIVAWLMHDNDECPICRNQYIP